MQESVNTNAYELLDAGSYVFCIEGVERVEKNNRVSYKWVFTHVKNGQRCVWTKYLWSSQMGDILRFTGMPEDATPGIFTLDYELIKGKMFSCDVVHEASKNGKVYEAIKNVQPVDTANPGGVTKAEDIDFSN